MVVVIGFSMPELILILVIALIVFGPGKLPEVGKAIGKGISEFRRATAEQPAPPVVKAETKEEAKPEEKK